jgi:hypothetical protein
MADPWIATQLAIGAADRAAFSDVSIEDAIAQARDVAHIDALILWPSAEPGLAEKLARTCRSRGIRAFLWFPVLSDQPGLPQPVSSLVMNCMGTRGHGEAGAWEGLIGGDERFLFSCPNDERSLEGTFDAFASHLASAELDGVMLDKIRFPSPSNGFESLLTCFCDSCRSLFHKETGQSMDRLRERACDLLLQLREGGPQDLFASWVRTGSLWKAAGLDELAAFRARSITRAVRRFSSQARSWGLEVGLDLFSPSLAPFVGQDYEALSDLCDWIKPMTYCRAVGPAGLPLEIASLWKGLRALDPRGDPAGIGRSLGELFHWEIPDTEAELLARGLPAAVISSELEAIGRMRLAAGVKVYAGIEAMRIPEFGIDVTADSLGQSLREVRAPADGIIASWNLLHIPEDNLRTLGKWKG